MLTATSTATSTPDISVTPAAAAATGAIVSVPTVDTAPGTSVTPAVSTVTPADPAVAAERVSVAPAATSFGVNASGGVLTVDSGAGLVFKVNQTNGNITSIRYKDGAEMQYWEKGSHIASGLGSSTVVTYAVNAGVAKVTLSTPTLTHYLLVRQGETPSTWGRSRLPSRGLGSCAG